MSNTAEILVAALMLLLGLPLVLLFRGMDAIMAGEGAPKTWVFMLVLLLLSVACFVITSLGLFPGFGP